jgi:hypothetical protein
VRQDALGGGGYVKWGGLDPSILVLRSTAAARAFVAAWREVLLMASGLPLDCLVFSS